MAARIRRHTTGGMSTNEGEKLMHKSSACDSLEGLPPALRKQKVEDARAKQREYARRSRERKAAMQQTSASTPSPTKSTTKPSTPSRIKSSKAGPGERAEKTSVTPKSSGGSSLKATPKQNLIETERQRKKRQTKQRKPQSKQADPPQIPSTKPPRIVLPWWV
ncbi:hypothetical protein AAF712_010419 [Marasmius tenuissimus]|uniref:Uncharacterized protein n=1 Tax=Marasmius tenuissimus TaxID=585030 RepID=A0ABR2ZP73_9AGAR